MGVIYSSPTHLLPKFYITASLSSATQELQSHAWIYFDGNPMSVFHDRRNLQLQRRSVDANHWISLKLIHGRNVGDLTEKYSTFVWNAELDRGLYSVREAALDRVSDCSTNVWIQMCKSLLTSSHQCMQ